MKLISEKRGIERLWSVRVAFAAEIRGSYEHRARPCSSCPTPGVCCRDEHFVNVRITRLEAAAIVERLGQLATEHRDRVFARVREAIEKYDLSAPGDPSERTFACPLFERGVGCLVHDSAKPLPCVTHACYDDPADLPPDEMLAEAEGRVASMNRRVYGRDSPALPLPLMIAGRT